jgi:NADPH-dependent 2,4-dienoyl-CoA reductase/sulfur reductase-like enzyme
MTHVVVVGASLAGLRTAESLRSRGFDGKVTLVGAERHLPYDRPPLSKRFLLGPDDESDSSLTDMEHLHRLEIDALLGHEAVSLRRENGWTLRLDDGASITCDRVVVATGAIAHQPLKPARTGVHTLRTKEDARAIRTAFASVSSVVVVGGGFIGSEVAAAARSHDLQVTIVEALGAPLTRVVGPTLAEQCARLHQDNGVRVVRGVAVTSLEGDARVTAVRLADGERIPAELVVVGVGARPATAWLADSELLLDDGVVCDEFGVAHPSGTVFAVGDVARWWHPLYSTSFRVEHWSHAVEQARTVAQNLIGPGRTSLLTVPYVWSDQYDLKMQIAGRPSPRHDLWWSDDGDARALTAMYARQGRVEGAVTFNRPRSMVTLRRLISEQARVADAIEALSDTSAEPSWRQPWRHVPAEEARGCDGARSSLVSHGGGTGSGSQVDRGAVPSAGLAPTSSVASARKMSGSR